MLCSQFLASSLRTSHPSHPYVTMPLGPRADHRKPTLQSRFTRDIERYLQDGVTPSAEYRDIIADIHTSTVRGFITGKRPNRILNTTPPAISPDEQRLPRYHRTTLSQLRSGFC